MRLRATILALALGGAGCSTTYSGLKAVSPAPPHGNVGPVVESLQPTLEWEPSAAQGATYDLQVAEVNTKTNFWKGTERSLGEVAYQREGLKESRHTLEQPLAPGREYVWAVRVRIGTEVGPWSTYGFFDFFGVAWRQGDRMLFRFRTPGEAAR